MKYYGLNREISGSIGSGSTSKKGSNTITAFGSHCPTVAGAWLDGVGKHINPKE